MSSIEELRTLLAQSEQSKKDEISRLVKEHCFRVQAMEANYAALEKELQAMRTQGSGFGMLQDKIQRLESNIAALAEGIEVKEGEAEQLQRRNQLLESSIRQFEEDAIQTAQIMREMQNDLELLHGQVVAKDQLLQEKEKVVAMQSTLLVEKDKKIVHLQELTEALRAERGGTVDRPRSSNVPSTPPQTRASRMMSQTIDGSSFSNHNISGGGGGGSQGYGGMNTSMSNMSSNHHHHHQPQQQQQQMKMGSNTVVGGGSDGNMGGGGAGSDRISELRRQLEMARLERERMQKARADREKHLNA